ncbi:MAG: alcohol dehydrogenase catalytic domain-containing protein, partial [Myxococcota bacterium]
MRAALLRGLGEKLEVRDDFTLEGPGPGEVRVRLVASGVCHSDLSFQNGTIPVPFPSIIGHEGAGELIAIGDGVEGLSEGDPVIISWVPPCGNCVCCLEHQPNLCMNGLIAAAKPHFRLGDEIIMSGVGTATFAEETVVPAAAAIPIPRDVPLDIASLVGCGVTTGVGAVLNTARVEPGSSVLVIGCGGVGVSVIQGARIAGATEIVAVDPVEQKQEWAKKFGATHVVSPDGLT